MPELDRDKILTLIGIVSLIVVALAFDVDVGFVAFSIAAVLMLISPKARKGAVEKVAWSTVLLICGIVMYVGLLEEIGTIDWLGEQVATIDRALLAALLICYVGAVVSAFASTTGILGALIPLAVPFLETGAVGAVGLIIALSISSSVVDSSPFSTSGALTVANTPEEHRERVFKRLMRWGMSMVVDRPADRVAGVRGARLAVIRWGIIGTGVIVVDLRRRPRVAPTRGRWRRSARAARRVGGRVRRALRRARAGTTATRRSSRTRRSTSSTSRRRTRCTTRTRCSRCGRASTSWWRSRSR